MYSGFYRPCIPELIPSSIPWVMGTFPKYLDTLRHRGGVPSMRIRDAPSARSVQRAAERLLGDLRMGMNPGHCFVLNKVNKDESEEIMNRFLGGGSQFFFYVHSYFLGK